MPYCPSFSFFFFFNDTATTEIYTLSLHDALPISLSAMTGVPAIWHVFYTSLARPIRRLHAQLAASRGVRAILRSEEHTSELQSPDHLVCRLLLEKKKKKIIIANAQLRVVSCT